MREVETDNSVIWPSWCYNTGETRLESEALKRSTSVKSPSNSKSKKKRRPISLPEKRMNGGLAIGSENFCPTQQSAFTNVCTAATASTASTASAAVVKMEVKAERLSPASATTDNNSSGSGSNTPSSSYPETPPDASNPNDRIPSPSLSPAAQLSHPKMTEQPMARNYSDIMRNLAAKYNNSNPNDYYNTSKNGLTFGDARFSFNPNAVSPFTNLVAPLISGNTSPPNSSCHLPVVSANTKESTAESDLKHMLSANEARSSLFSSFGLSSFNSAGNLPLFPPLVDMGSTQALLNMVRNASSGSVNHLENYIKNAASTKRAAEVANNPLDLSSSMPPSSKKAKRPSCSPGDSFTSEYSTTHHRIKDHVPVKRTGSVSPKPRSTKSILSVPRTPPPTDQRVAAAAANCLSACTSSLDRTCPSREGVENVSNWSIDDVYNFVSSIDICSEYADNFREQSIDGISLPLLTEEHLRTTMNMKLGPALKFRAILAQKIGHCSVCMHCLHCHGGGVAATNGRSSTPIPNSSPSSFCPPAVRPNSTGH